MTERPDTPAATPPDAHANTRHLETPVSPSPGLVVRLLPVAEWGRLATAPGPLRGSPLPPADYARILVAEDHGVIIAYWVVSAAIHLDPLFIAEDFRHHPHLAQAFLGLLVTTLQTLEVTHVYAIIGDGDQPGNGRLAEKLGLAPLQGRLYAGPIPAAE